MSDSYQVLLDVKASAKEATSLMSRAVSCLVDEGLIFSSRDSVCVLGDDGYPAGPACSELYTAQSDEVPFWTLDVNGVEAHTDPWVNLFGFTIFEEAKCPRCGKGHTSEFLGQVAAAVEGFVVEDIIPEISCFACAEKSVLHSWYSVPHPGFVNFALVFWSWPSFEAIGWKVDVPGMLRKHLQRPLIASYGHV